MREPVGSLDEARALARAIYENYSLRHEAHKELLRLSKDARAVLENLIALMHGKYVDLDYVLDDLQREPRLCAMAQALGPLVEHWEAVHGPVTTTLYSNRKKTDERADDGASEGLKWLAKELSDIADGPSVSTRTVLTMFSHLRR